MLDYNATIYNVDNDTDRVVSTFVGHVDADGRILRSNAVQCTGLEDTPEYDTYFRAIRVQSAITKNCRLVVEFDGCAGYRNAIGGGPAYKVAA